MPFQDSISIGLNPIFPKFQSGLIKSVIYSNSCVSDTITFSLNNITHVDSAKWYFGDSLSSNNQQKGFTVQHKFTQPGAYIITTVLFKEHACLDTFKTYYTAQPSPIFNLGNDTILCGDSLTIAPTNLSAMANRMRQPPMISVSPLATSLWKRRLADCQYTK